MGCTWESDGLRPSFHGLYMGVGQFEVFVPWVEHGVRWFGVFIPWVEHLSLMFMLKMGRKPREGILHSLPCLVPRVRAMSKVQPKGTNSLYYRCMIIYDGMGLALWLWQPHK